MGGSIAGLLTARALSDRYRRVVVVERDRLPDGPGHRRGVPQDRQVHVLLNRGAEVLEELFPGLLAEFTAAGAVESDVQQDINWYMDGRKLASAASGIVGLSASRLLLEHLIRRRVMALPNVEIRPETEATGLVQNLDTITGVAIATARGDGGDAHVLDADLVVDACGRSSRSLEWLAELGHPRPPQSHVRADVVYVTRRYKAAPDPRDRPARATVVPYPGNPRGAAIVYEENDRVALVLFGLLGADPTTDESAMKDYARKINSPEVDALMRTGTPVEEPIKMRYAASVRRHPERGRSRPRNFLLLGDSLVSFNPTYGQGMTTAALQAQVLSRLVAEGVDRLPERFYPAAAKAVDPAWQIATGGDLRFPEVTGRRPPGSAFGAWYLDRFRAAAVHDPRLLRTFLTVSGLQAPLPALLAPGVMLRVLRNRRR